MPKTITITNLKIKEFNVVPLADNDFVLCSSYAFITDTGLEMPAVRKTTKWKDIPQEQREVINTQIKTCKKFSDLFDVAETFLKTQENL